MNKRTDLTSFLEATRESGSSSPVTVALDNYEDEEREFDNSSVAASTSPTTSWLDAQRDWLSSAFGNGGSIIGNGSSDTTNCSTANTTALAAQDHNKTFSKHCKEATSHSVQAAPFNKENKTPEKSQDLPFYGLVGFQQFTLAQSNISNARPVEALECLTKVLRLHSSLEVITEKDGAIMIDIHDRHPEINDAEDEEKADEQTPQHLHLLQAQARYQIGRILFQLSTTARSNNMKLSKVRKVVKLATEHVPVPALLLNSTNTENNAVDHNSHANDTLMFHAMVELQTSYRLLKDMEMVLLPQTGDTLSQEMASKPQLRIAVCHLLARIHSKRLNEEYQALAKLEETQALLQEAIQNSTSPIDSYKDRSDLARSYMEAGNILYGLERYESSTPQYETALYLYQRLVYSGTCAGQNDNVLFLKRRLGRSTSDIYHALSHGRYLTDQINCAQ